MNCGKVVKPDVTLYEESLDMDVFVNCTSYSATDLLIIGVVYPATSLVNYFLKPYQ